MKATVSFATKARWSDAWPGRLERLDRQPAGLERALDDLDAVALDELRVAGDVIGVRVRRQQVRHVQALALDDLVQRLERRAAVDEDRRAAGLVREQVRVREPVGMHAPLDQHGKTVHGEKGSRPAMASSSLGARARVAARAWRLFLRRVRQRRKRYRRNRHRRSARPSGARRAGRGGDHVRARPAAAAEPGRGAGPGADGTETGGSATAAARARRHDLRQRRARAAALATAATSTFGVRRRGGGRLAESVPGAVAGTDGGRGASPPARVGRAGRWVGATRATACRAAVRFTDRGVGFARRRRCGRLGGGSRPRCCRRCGPRRGRRPAAPGRRRSRRRRRARSRRARRPHAASGSRAPRARTARRASSGTGGRKTGLRIATVGGSSCSRSERRARKSSIWIDATVEPASSAISA